MALAYAPEALTWEDYKENANKLLFLYPSLSLPEFKDFRDNKLDEMYQWISNKICKMLDEIKRESNLSTLVFSKVFNNTKFIEVVEIISSKLPYLERAYDQYLISKKKSMPSTQTTSLLAHSLTQAIALAEQKTSTPPAITLAAATTSSSAVPTQRNRSHSL